MNTRLIYLIAVCALAAASQAAEKKSWVDLFDGISLKGWAQKNGTATYRDFHEPPQIRGESFTRVVESMESSARARADVAFYWLLTCGAAVVLAALLLWLLRRVDQRVYAKKAV
jgi:hypothetical protein